MGAKVMAPVQKPNFLPSKLPILFLTKIDPDGNPGEIKVFP